MILKRLSEFADRIDIPPAMYAPTPIRWVIDLDGNKPHWISLQGEGKRGLRGEEKLAPGLKRTTALAPKLLADTGEYVLGIARDPGKAERVAGAHRLFRELTARCAAETGLPEVQAVANFLAGWNPSEPTDLPEEFDAGDVITFRVGERLVIDLPEVRSFWADYTAKEQSSAPIMQCLVCSQVRPVMERLPLPIKGIPGGQTSGMALISANSNAFESHGLTASLTAPTCRDCAERFSNAMNALLKDRSHSVIIGPVAFIFWTREETVFNPRKILTQPEEGDVKQLYAAPFTGQEPESLDPNVFYALSLSASGARVVIRDYIETTVGRAQASLRRWLRLQEIVDVDGGEGLPYGIFALGASLCRDANKEMSANVVQALLRCALYADPLPEWLIFQAVRRNRAEQRITRPRAALIKATLLSPFAPIDPDQENTMTELKELDPRSTNRAYLCGRLLAELEEIQRQAVPGAKATIIDRYFGTASSAPATAFGTLLRGAQSHLAKLRKERTGAYVGLQNRLEEILSGLDEFPRALSLQDQALFSLGYYHQRAADRKAAREAKERRNQEQEDQN